MEGGVIQLWCEREGGWRGGVVMKLVKARQDEHGWRGLMVTAQDPGGEGLRGGQKNGLDFCMNNICINMGELGCRSGHTIRGILLRV